MGVEVGYALASFALSYAANKLLAAKNKSPIQDAKPTPIVSKGEFLPLLIGKRRVGAVIGYAGLNDRSTKKEKIDGGKGSAFGSPKQTVYYEIGWHMTVVGPVSRLNKIWQNGKPIFVGPIDGTSHPSGTTVDIGKEGIFEVWWGEADQPNNSTLADADRLGIDSQWPFIPSILWNKKRLGTQPVWQLIDYEIEVRPVPGSLTKSKPWFEPVETLDTPHEVDIYTVTNGLPGVATIDLQGKYKSRFPIGGKARIDSNSATADGDYDIWDVEYDGDTNITSVTLGNKLSGAVAVTGTLIPYTYSYDVGANAAHAIHQLLFEDFPHGLGIPRSKVDLVSLEDLGQVMEEERLPVSVYAQNGAEALAILGNLLQDMGVMAPIVNGKLTFKAIRKPIAAIPDLPSGLVMDPKPEIEVLHHAQSTSRLIYVFDDVERNYKEGTVFIDDDGRAARIGYPAPQKVEIPSVIDYETAAKVSERRSQEANGSANKYRISANRNSRELYAGQAFTALSEIDAVMRVSSKKVDYKTGRVSIVAVDDFYGVTPSTFENSQGGGLPGDPEEPVNDLQFDIVEIPGYLVGEDEQGIVVPRIRATDAHSQADIWLSVDDVTYTNVGQELDFHAGGTLIDAVASTEADYLAQGPTFTALGPDIDTVLDLSADQSSWAAGRQLCVLTDGTSTEIWYVQKVTAIGGTTYRLDGVLKQRLASGKKAWSAGTRVYVFKNDGIVAINDILLAPNTTVYVKTQPSTGSTLPLDECSKKSRLLKGKGRIPENPGAIRKQGDTSNTYTPAATPGDITFEWSYRSLATPRTGAGMQGGGAASAASPIRGTFVIRVRNSVGTLVREENVGSDLTYTYTQANYLFDLGSVSSYKFGVVNVNGGYSSDEVQITMTAI